MILTCPQCSTKFNIPDDILGDDGKTVRCSVCENSWHQMPEPAQSHDQTSDDDDWEKDLILPGQLSDDETPDSIRPFSFNAEDTQQSEKNKHLILLISGVGALTTFLLIFLFFLTLKGPLTSANPGLHGFYAFFGMKPAILKTDIIFNTKAEIHDDKIFITGELSNLSENAQDIPMIMATQLDEYNQELGRFMIAPPQETLAPGESIPFTSQYKAIDHVAQIKLNFTIQKATLIDDEKHMAADEHHNEEHTETDAPHHDSNASNHDENHTTDHEQSSHAQEDHHMSPAEKSDEHGHH